METVNGIKIHCKYDQLLSLDEIKFHPKNRNKHPQEQIERLAKIFKYNGVRKPAVISELSGLMTAGHGRVLTARHCGMEFYPVVFQHYDSDVHEYDDIQADNATALWAELDFEAIAEDVKEFDMHDDDMLGIKDFDPLDDEFEEHDGDPDDVPGSAPAICKPGDLWELGNHRLLCGDATSLENVHTLMGNEIADITFTSPPYNAGTFGFQKGLDKYKGKSDNKTQDEYFDFLVLFTNICLEKSKYVFFNNQFLSGNRYALGKYFGHYNSAIKEFFPWIKNTAPPNVNKGVFSNRFEFILCLEKNNTKKGFPVDWQGKFHNVIDGHTAANENVSKGEHKATMPMYVVEWFIERLDFVKSIYDPFAGTGTTLIACEKNRLKSFNMELDANYCDIIIKRWETFTNKKVVLLNGKT